MTRNILDKRLKSLISELAEMGSLVEKQIYDSINALKNHDVEHMLLKTEYEQLQKQYNDSLKEIKRLQGLVVKYQNANRSKNSASLN